MHVRALLLLCALLAAAEAKAVRLHEPCESDADCEWDSAVCLARGVGRRPICGCEVGTAPSPKTGRCEPTLGTAHSAAVGYSGARFLRLPEAWYCSGPPGAQCWSVDRHGHHLRLTDAADVAAVREGSGHVEAHRVLWRCADGSHGRLRPPHDDEPHAEMGEYCHAPAAPLPPVARHLALAPGPPARGATVFYRLPALSAEVLECPPGSVNLGSLGCAPDEPSGEERRRFLVRGPGVHGTLVRGWWRPHAGRVEFSDGRGASGVARCEDAAAVALGTLEVGPCAVAIQCDDGSSPTTRRWCSREEPARKQQARAELTCQHGHLTQRERTREEACAADDLHCDWKPTFVEACECVRRWYGVECSHDAGACERERCHLRGSCAGQLRGCRCQPPFGGHACETLECGPWGTPRDNSSCECHSDWDGPACNRRRCGRLGTWNVAGAKCDCLGDARVGADGTCSEHWCGPSGWVGPDGSCRCPPGGWRGGRGCQAPARSAKIAATPVPVVEPWPLLALMVPLLALLSICAVVLLNRPYVAWVSTGRPALEDE